MRSLFQTAYNSNDGNIVRSFFVSPSKTQVSGRVLSCYSS